MQDVLQHLTDRKNLWAIGDGENGFSSVPNGFFCYCYMVEIKLNILTLEYTKQMCYNAITSKKHSLFTMILYREIRLPKLLTADKNKATEALGAYQVKKQGEYTLEDYYALPDDQRYELINGGHIMTTGFAHGTVLANAQKVISAIRQGKIKHIFLVGGCDGAHPGRNYYTEFVKQTPMDTLVLTLACGKFRFNDLDLGEIEGLPRIMDMGQCNDAYSAIKVAVALAEAFDCEVNDLPLTLVLTWYEQKAVCILLTLLALGIKNIYLGPTFPAFLSEGVTKVLRDAYNLQPITAPEQDLDAILGRG